MGSIVATANVGCQLDLKTVALHLRNAEYNPKRFPAVSIRIRDPKTTALIFKSGKMVITGAKSICDQREWEALERANPGANELIASGLPSATAAEKLALR